MPVYDNRTASNGPTTSPEQYLSLVFEVEAAAAQHANLTALVADILDLETVEQRREYFQTLALLIRKADYEAARALMDEEVF